jgi:hypothetical protein
MADILTHTSKLKKILTEAIATLKPVNRALGSPPVETVAEKLTLALKLAKKIEVEAEELLASLDEDVEDDDDDDEEDLDDDEEDDD